MKEITYVHFLALEPSRSLRFTRFDSVESTLDLNSATLVSFFSSNRVSMLTGRSASHRKWMAVVSNFVSFL